MISEKDMIDYSKQLDSNIFIFSFKTISSLLEKMISNVEILSDINKL